MPAGGWEEGRPVPHPSVISPLTTAVRGSSSADFPKKSYNTKFTDAFGNKSAQALLDQLGPDARRRAYASISRGVTYTGRGKNGTESPPMGRLFDPSDRARGSLS